MKSERTSAWSPSASRRTAAWLGALLVGAGFGASRASEINPPLGPYMNPKPADFVDAANFTTNDRVVLTSYFYWYDVYSSAHLIDPDGTDALTDHPPTLTDFSYKSKAWHRTQLLDMIDAGIDVLLPVYWGEPSQRILGLPISAQPWSYSGIPPLVQAREELVQEGKKPPAIGMFYDTSTLQYNAAGQRIDLTTPYGREWFYESVRDFFSLIPAKHWAMIDGRPVVFLYSASFAAKHDQSCIDYLRTNFAQAFGGRAPFIVREISWQVQSDNVYAWGGALGLRNPGVASLGPGYNDSAVEGRTPTVVSRQGGAFFSQNWAKFLGRPSKLVAIETWDEFHEGTDIAASREYGRQYIDLNRKYADMFKQGIRPPRPRGPYTDAKSVSVTLQATNLEAGVVQMEGADGATRPAEIGGSACRMAVATVYSGRFIYCRIDESFKWADLMEVDVEVEYYDSAGGSFHIEFDGSDLSAPFQGAYTSTKLTVPLQGSSRWKTATFHLTGAHFQNSQNGGADFRIVVQADPFDVRRVKVLRLGLPDEAGATLHGFQQDFAAPLGTNWVQFGAGGSAFEQAGGLLAVHANAAGPSYLLLNPSAASATNGEVLARVRIVGFGTFDAHLGGLVCAFNTNLNLGIDFGFRAAAAGGSQMELYGPRLPPGPEADFPWQTNLWYWLRLRHQTNGLTHYPDVLARIWLADGETPEPDTWRIWWDYYPANSARQGLAGILADVGVPATLEVDCFLFKSEALPEITVQLPELKPARPKLAPVAYLPSTGFQMRLSGASNTGYFLESSSNLTEWAGPLVWTDANGAALLTDTNAPSQAHRFYRARQAQ